MPLWEQAALLVCQLSDTLETLDMDQRDTLYAFYTLGATGAN